MFELMKLDTPDTPPYESVYVFDKLEDAFKEAYFFDDGIQWQYVNADDMIYFEGWTGADSAQPSYIIKTAGAMTPIEQPDDDDQMV